MSKIKMRCSVCGKPFKSANPKQVMCDPCEAKARREKGKQPARTITTASAARPLTYTLPPMAGSPASTDKSATTLPTAAGSHPSPGQRPASHPAGATPGRADSRPGARPPQRPPERPKSARRPAEGQRSQRPRRPTTPPKPKEPRQPTPPFTPTAEQVAAIERRYLELANPTEYDGIRTQIAAELHIPKSAVKKVVQALRTRLHIPSWWDVQGYHGSPEDLERIRALYLPYLPVPPIGVHRLIAAELSLSPGTVYQGIKAIRAEMNLPQYNPPELHGDELPAAGQTPAPAAPEATAADMKAPSEA